MVEYKLDSEGAPCEYKTPFRRNTTWHRVPTPALQPLPRAQVEGRRLEVASVVVVVGRQPAPCSSQWLSCGCVEWQIFRLF